MTTAGLTVRDYVTAWVDRVASEAGVTETNRETVIERMMAYIQQAMDFAPDSLLSTTGISRTPEGMTEAGEFTYQRAFLDAATFVACKASNLLAYLDTEWGPIQ